MAKRKRGYSREYRSTGATRQRYMLDAIPAGLWRKVRAKATREGVSLRALILSQLETWVEEKGAGR